jgi:GxxExxY protein
MLQHLADIPLSQLTEQAVDGKVFVELKSVQNVHPAHKKQMLTCLRLTGMKPGSWLNFGGALLNNGITRMVRGEL